MRHIEKLKNKISELVSEGSKLNKNHQDTKEKNIQEHHQQL